MIVKLFETENEKPNVISREKSYRLVANETLSEDELYKISESISSKYGLDTVCVKWSSVPIKSKLIIASNPYLKDYICLNPKSFLFSGINKDNVAQHIEYHIKQYKKIKEDKSFEPIEETLADWFDGISAKYIYSCSCGFTRGSVHRKETLRVKFLRKPICCSSEYHFGENPNNKVA